jgi:O-antigen/teichoic acid export membrane protein
MNPEVAPVSGEVPPGSALRRLLTGTMNVTVALMAGNVLAYAVTLLAARLLGAADLGVLASLLAVFTLGSVPAVALQTVGAVHTAGRTAATSASSAPAGWPKDPDPRGGAGQLHGAAVTVSGLTALILLAVGPALVALLDLPSFRPLIALALASVPVNLAGIAIGRLQGAERFGAMALAHGGMSVGKFGGAIGGLLLGGTTLTVFVGAAAGALLMFGLAAGLAGSVCAVTRPDPALLTATVHAGAAMFALLTLVNVDLLLARALLPATDAGGYAVLAVLTKAAFWLPQAVTAVALPRLARGHAGVLPMALGATAGVGALLVLFLVPTGGPVVVAIGGSAFAGLGALAWLFGLSGALWSLVNLAVNARLARRSTIIAPLLIGALIAECTVVATLTGRSITTIAATAAAVAAATLALALPGRRPAADGRGGRAARQLAE